MSQQDPRRTRTGMTAGVQRAIDVAVPALLVLAALAPLWPVYRSGHAVIAAVVGVGLGSAVAYLGARRRWNAIVVTAATLGALIATAALTAPTTAIAGVLPTLETWRTLGVAVVRVWKQVVTLQPPLGNADGLLTVVYLLALVGSVVAVTVALRARGLRPLALVAPALVLVASVLLGTTSAMAPILVAGVGVVAGLCWPAWRSGRIELNRPLATGALVAAAVAGVVGGTVLAPPQGPRYVVREHVDPPPLQEDYPSPLAGHRGYLKDFEDIVLMTVDGLPPELQRLRLATLDTYNGLVWDVSNGQTPAGGRYLRATDRFVPQLDPDAIELSVTIGAYNDVWLPMTGRVEDVSFTGENADTLASGVFYNAESATALVTATLTESDSFTLTTVPTPTVTGDQLGGQVISELALPPVTRSPEGLAALASRLTEGATTDAARVQALALGLSSEGFFSHGLQGDVPSLAGHGLARMNTMVDETEMVGDAEQYASLMALMARELGWPARVVYGFVRDERDTGATWEVEGRDVSAWVEVHFQDVGWVAFDPTPDENNVPASQDPAPADRPQPQMLQPPPPPVPAPDIPSLDTGDAEVDPQEEPEEEPEVPIVVRWLGYLGIPLVLAMLPALVAVALKARRRRRRQRRGDGAARVAGAWLELQDTAIDLGMQRRPTATRREEAAALNRTFADVDTAGATSTTLLASRADAAVFGPLPATAAEAEEYWRLIVPTERALRGQLPLRRRVRARFSYASLRRAQARRRSRRSRGGRSAPGTL